MNDVDELVGEEEVESAKRLMAGSTYEVEVSENFTGGSEQLLAELEQSALKQQAEFVQRDLPYAAGNVFSLIQQSVLKLRDVGDETPVDPVKVAEYAEIIARRIGVENSIDPAAVESFVAASIHYEDHQGIVSERPRVYQTIQDRLDAADLLIDQRLERADEYPYYDLYREKGLLHEDDESGIPYVIVYRSTTGDVASELAAGLRHGLFSASELTDLPVSLRTLHPDPLYELSDFETKFSLDQVEAFNIGASGHASSPYLSASRADTDKFAGDVVLKVKVPACLTLPVEFLQAPVENYRRVKRFKRMTEMGVKMPRPDLSDREDGEKEIAILGRIRPEWILDRRKIEGKTTHPNPSIFATPE